MAGGPGPDDREVAARKKRGRVTPAPPFFPGDLHRPPEFYCPPRPRQM